MPKLIRYPFFSSKGKKREFVRADGYRVKNHPNAHVCYGPFASDVGPYIMFYVDGDVRFIHFNLG